MNLIDTQNIVFLWFLIFSENMLKRQYLFNPKRAKNERL